MNFKKFSLILSLLYLNQKVFSIPIENESTTSIASLNENVLESVVEDIEVNAEKVTALEDSSDDENVETKTVNSEATTEPVIPVTREECLTEECSEISKSILNKMDTSVNPCENFYQFTCGGWHDNNKNEKMGFSVTKEQENIINTEISELLKGDYIVNENLSKEDQEYDRKTFKKMKTLYNLCMNLANNYDSDAEKEHLVDFIKNFNIYKVEGENKLEKFTNLYVKLKNAGLRIPFIFNIHFDNTDNKKHIELLINDHSLNSDYLKYPELDSIFKEFIKKVLSIIYDNEQEVEEMVKIIFKVEKKIQSLQLSELSNIDIENYQSEDITLNDLKQRYPFIDWELYLKKRIELYGMEYDNFDEVVFNDINNKDVREAINSFYNDIDFNDLATYMEWYNLLILNEISEDIYNASNEIYKEFVKYNSNSDDNSFGNNFNSPYEYNNNSDEFNEFPTDGYLSVDGDFLYDDFLNDDSLDNEFPGDLNNDIDEIMKLMDVKCVDTESMLERIPKLEWLDEETKQKAIEKLLKMKDIIGYQEKYDNPKMIYKLYEYINYNNPLTTYLSNTLFTDGLILSNICKLIFKPMEVNAYYSGILNSIYFPTSLLKSQFYDSNQPDYLNYGFMGTTIGHEVTHGFDNNGRYLDGDGNKISWWTDDDDKDFIELSQCYINQ
ncbi:hypothetical protein PIROE2DRAFT_15209 [Piromyces sp. E2]|nr:hypothetical protein PIROE2DRAFT_15209 [Piromyces sp. E2]|eukprot:OUM59292.1 hypothetical protein PIROE2DRAFT_15209 [Piromyces sp. E2]